MAGKGAAPVPTAILKARGSWRADERDAEPVFPDADLAAPMHLEGVSMEKWNELAPCLATAGVLRATNRDTLANYCEAWSSYLELLAKVRADGWTVFDSKGGEYKNPNAALLGETRIVLLRFQQELGLTPSSQSRVKVDKAKDNKNSIQNLVKVG